LDIFNYLSLLLIDGRGLGNTDQVPQDVLVNIHAAELGNHGHFNNQETLITQLLSHPEAVETPVKRRLFIFDAFRTNNAINQFLEAAQDHEQLEEGDLYFQYTALSEKYEALLDRVEGPMSSAADRESQDYPQLVVDLRTLVFVFTRYSRQSCMLVCTRMESTAATEKQLPSLLLPLTLIWAIRCASCLVMKAKNSWRIC
jgi:hypothetical protein